MTSDQGPEECELIENHGVLSILTFDWKTEGTSQSQMVMVQSMLMCNRKSLKRDQGEGPCGQGWEGVAPSGAPSGSLVICGRREIAGDGI